MFIVNPKDDSVLTLKPEMIMKEYKKKYTLVTYPGVVYDPGEKPKNVYFVINIKYDDMMSKLESEDKFIMSQWKEV